MLGAIAQLDDVEHLVDPIAGAASVVVGEELQIPPSAHVRVEARPLDEARDPVHGARSVDERVASEQARGAGGGSDQSEQHAQGGRLAGAVGAEVAEHVARLDGEVDVVDRDDLTVGLHQPSRDHRCLVAHRSSRAAASAAAEGIDPARVVETSACCQVTMVPSCVASSCAVTPSRETVGRLSSAPEALSPLAMGAFRSATTMPPSPCP